MKNANPLILGPDRSSNGQTHCPRPLTNLRFVLSRDVVSMVNRGMRQFNGQWQLSKPYLDYQLHVFFTPSNYVDKVLTQIPSVRVTAQQQHPKDKNLDLACGKYLADEVSVFLSKFSKNESGQLVDQEWIQVISDRLIDARRLALFKLHFKKWKPKNQSFIAEYERLMKEYAASPFASFIDGKGKSQRGSEIAEHYSNVLRDEQKKALDEQAGLMSKVYTRIGFKVCKIEEVEFSKPCLPGLKKFFFEEEIEEALRKWHQLIDLVEPAG